MAKVKKENDGTFTIDFIKKINGKRFHITKKGFASIDEAERMIPILLEKKISLIKQVRIKGEFGWFFSSYIEYRNKKVGGSTILSIKAIYNVLLKEYEHIEAYEVLSVHNIIHLYKTIVDRKDTGEKWKNRVIGELRQIVDYALFLKIINVEEANDDKTILVPIPIIKKGKEKSSYTVKQIKKYLSVVDDDNDKELLTVYIYLGARISEFIALTWDCYDRCNKTIEIKQQILYLQQGKPVLVDRLKTKESYRKCKLNNEIVEVLERRRIESGGKEYIFPKSINNKNEPLPKTTLRKIMHKYMVKAKLPIISPHGFRHSKATMFMSVCKNMAEVKAAAKFLGHSVTMMMETYAHSEEKTIDTLIKRLEDNYS